MTELGRLWLDSGRGPTPHFLKANPPFAPPEEFFGAAARHFSSDPMRCAQPRRAERRPVFHPPGGGAAAAPPGPGLKQTQQRGKGADNHRRAGLSIFSRALKLHMVLYFIIFIIPRRWSSSGFTKPPAVGHVPDSPNPPRPGNRELRHSIRASSRGFPRKFLAGMAQNRILNASA